MNALARFSAAARGQAPAREVPSILPDSKSPGVAVSALFPYQSYFDSTSLEKAILTQSTNEPIVGSTLRQEQIPGYALALSPNSQAPVAVQPLVGGSSAASQAVILRPGQIYRPHGKPDGFQGNFSGFRWGLPFGWLGGGVVTLYVLPSADAKVDWPGVSPEIIFHRQRMQILAPASVAAAASKNWPMRFPWTQASRGASAISQAGAAIIGIAEPTRITMSLVLTALPTASDMRIVFQETNDFDLDSTGAVIATQARFVDYTWGTYAASGITGNLNTAYPVFDLTGPAARLAADDGGVALVDMTPGVTAGAPGLITGQYVDIVRYGKL